MPNIIDSIQISSSTFDVRDKSATTVVNLTQEQYDNLPSSAKTANVLYNITDATAGDLSQYWTSAQTNSAITQATSGKVDTTTFNTYSGSVETTLSGKQDTLVSGTNIKTINNESILGSGNINIQGGGGKAVTGGTNISVATGETADTINCTLPITAETSSTKCLIKIGANLNVSNGSNYEWAIGRYNITRTVASGSWANSGNTAFSIGIGTPWNSYNGLEVRQNGDVYIADTRTGTYPYQYKMIKLQDAVAALDTKQTTLTAGTGIDITDNVISATGGGGGITSGEVQSMIDDSISGKADTTAVTQDIAAAVSGKIDTSTFETYSGNVETALSGKQDTLVSGTNIKTINNESLLGSGNIDIQGGGKAIEAGTGIAITTGETADTVSLDINAKKGSNTTALVFNYTNANTATEAGATSFGYMCKATNQYTFANGNNTQAKGYYSHSEGESTIANGWGSHSDGQYTNANGKASHTEGSYVNADNDYESSQGRYNVSNKANTTWGDSGNTLFSVGNGASNSARHNAFEIRQNGDIYLSLNGQDVKLQDQLGGGGGSSYTAGRGIDITNNTISVSLPISAGTGANSVIESTFNNIASGDSSHAEGYLTLAKGAFSHAEGDTTSATSSSSHAEGNQTKAAGNYSHAEGSYSIASGRSSHAEGSVTKATGNYSHAEGWETSATSEASHSEGSGTTASGEHSHAEGYKTSATSVASHAEGAYNKTSNSYEHASGQYNVSSSASTTFGDSGNTLFSVGNGTADNARHNAFEIRQNGDIYLSNGTSDIKLQNTITATTANTNALGGLKLVKLTQSAYDALTTKDNNTLYIIVN